MLRNIQDSLVSWAQKPSRRPLLLRGARQVGKTWALRELGASFEHFVEINLDADLPYRRLFEEHYGSPAELIRGISFLSQKRIEPGKTLLFLDEIQECRQALMSLRYFREKMPMLHVAAAGSLLEFAMRELSFPVGRIEFMHLFPLNFEEFLIARGRAELAQSIAAGHLLPPGADEFLTQELGTYSLIGGMPAVVKAFLSTDGDLRSCEEELQVLISAYRADFHKYVKRCGIEHLQITFEMVPKLLGQKFKYVNVSRNYKSRELSQAVDLLEDAGLIYKAIHSSGNGVPLAAEAKPEQFKIFFLDIGLCHRALGVPLHQAFIEKDRLLVNRGGLAEQFVAQEIVSYTPKNEAPALYYWHREARSANAEIDFLLTRDTRVIPIEVNSGESRKSKSLDVFIAEKAPSYALRVSSTVRAHKKEDLIREVRFHSFFAQLKL